MANTLATNLQVSLGWDYRHDAGNSRTIVDAAAISRIVEYPNGSGSGHASLAWHAYRTLGDGASDDFDLSTLTNSFGEAIEFGYVKMMLVRNYGNYILEVGGAASNPWSSWLGSSTHKLLLAGGSSLLIENPAGYAVGAGNKVLRLKAPATGVSYDIALIGSGV